MPLYEARSFTRSSLTKQQKREQEAAIYGLSSHQINMAVSLTVEEIERMRQFVLQHDSERNNSIKEFDLNNPPQEPYVYREFPRLMYRGDATRVATSHAEVAEAEAHGWSKTPPAPKREADSDSEEETALEIEAAEAKARAVAKKK
jgi:hypothetical protein